MIGHLPRDCSPAFSLAPPGLRVFVKGTVHYCIYSDAPQCVVGVRAQQNPHFFRTFPPRPLCVPPTHRPGLLVLISWTPYLSMNYIYSLRSNFSFLTAQSFSFLCASNSARLPYTHILFQFFSGFSLGPPVLPFCLLLCPLIPFSRACRE